MAKNKNETTTPKKNFGTKTTLAKKAKRVLQSNGLHFFKTWADKPTSGGRRVNSSRGAFKTENPALYRKLISKGEILNRRMDRPPEPKVKLEESEIQTES